ncbi:Proline-rich protein 3 [Morella rubra]|uniref:Proline-rich protein 3 n=1 Tax=Morella rubra TaxID=262757 RepID=A0A6A1USF6_9ROSI|nr:Proline-rich protein 3 [Morella rubra]
MILTQLINHLLIKGLCIVAPSVLHPSIILLLYHHNKDNGFHTSFLLFLSLSVIASASDSGYAPKPDYGKPKTERNDTPFPSKPEYHEKPKLKGDDTHLPPKPDYQKPNPELIVGIQGVVLCKSGSKYVPIKGAVARIACLAADENGYETTPFSILSNECDANGYFLATYLFLPVDVNHGISGAPLFLPYLNDKHMKLYSVGPFFYTSKPQSVPKYGY